METPVLLAFEGAVATVTLNRPDKRNALSDAMWKALPLAIADATARPATRVIIVCGAGGHFATGADIEEFDIGDVNERQLPTSILSYLNSCNVGGRSH